MSHNTVKKGAREIDAVENKKERDVENKRIRREGGGRRKLTDKNANLVNDLKRLVEPATRGDPMSPLRWTNKSTYTLSSELRNQGYAISAESVGTLLKEQGYRLQTNRKTKEGKQHPDRNAQFEYINEVRLRFMRQRQPVISVDTKKKE
jgi:transposase